MKKLPHIIRKAELNDIEELILLRSRLLDDTHYCYSSHTLEEQKVWKKNYRSWLIDNLNRKEWINILVAENHNDKKLYGCVTGIIDHRAPAQDCLNGLSGWIQSMVVLPELQRSGIGTKLIQQLLMWFLALEIKKITLQSTVNSEIFYTSVGFLKSDENTFYYISESP
ncbi:GNAT family N-acetyltransferase [Xenorhabdus bovienii]|uniref:GNAT family N-acetyltransferase n=1 Tax=Xenorhabdus bovienii TaxID=40576 RepID=UPI0023B217D6|nr:GNAT family N-acetyltransferase [Xenorhabdus bovienii]MDE9493468.1 GNAT family N-acetyltransferase [Xenorhabdus bovienii]MDE9502005.1 GNAT family N-acetyltransferase [Xenorhabdus bovienii]MDE9519014.1 GNAT family N-acetyltransferase [Xenorhabdus bovienii]MDE9524393.1 GNAT family N-acetyltransferase [Xenorhabdus bovienii]MDE9570042.1 GNAT family N-acetyltransferase [Xenorhabdus bovienii]